MVKTRKGQTMMSTLALLIVGALLEMKLIGFGKIIHASVCAIAVVLYLCLLSVVAAVVVAVKFGHLFMANGKNITEI